MSIADSLKTRIDLVFLFGSVFNNSDIKFLLFKTVRQNKFTQVMFLFKLSAKVLTPSS